MAANITQVKSGEDVWGKHYVRVFDVTLDTSYPNSTGYVINAGDVGLRVITGVTVIGGNKAAGTLIAWPDLLGAGAGGAEVESVALRLFQPTGGGGANPTTLAAPKVTTGASTASAVDATTPTITPGIGKEVANTADVSAYVYRLQFVGF